MQEIWRDIKGYEGIYQVSNQGRVKSLDRIDYSGHQRKGKLLKLVKTHYKRTESTGKYGDGYLIVSLGKEGKRKRQYVQRLVAEAFIPNDDPENKTTVDHINENKTDNRVENLEWVSTQENINRNHRSGSHTKQRSVRVTILDTGEIIEAYSSREMDRKLGLKEGAIKNTRQRKKSECAL